MRLQNVAKIRGHNSDGAVPLGLAGQLRRQRQNGIATVRDTDLLHACLGTDEEANGRVGVAVVMVDEGPQDIVGNAGNQMRLAKRICFGREIIETELLVFRSREFF